MMIGDLIMKYFAEVINYFVINNMAL